MEDLKTNPVTALKKYKKGNIGELVLLLEQANQAYRHRSVALMSDDVYDMAEDHLRRIAPDHPFLQKVGEVPEDNDNKVKLPFWMGSLDKIKDDGEKAIKKYIASYPGKYVVSHKLDGNSALFVVSSTGSTALYSRGDGKDGQDLSGMIGHINTLPNGKVLAAAAKLGKADTLAIRGELIISKRNWDVIKAKGANARNVVAGVMHAKKPDMDVLAKVDFVAYELLQPRLSYGEGLKYMANLGFRVAWNKEVDEHGLTIENLSQILVHERDASEYEIDGIVVAHDAMHRHLSGKNPKHAFAFKSIMTHVEAEVVVGGVEWNISKDGYLKPTIVFPEVIIGGVRIKRATGNNAAFIKNNGIGVGARLMIIRSGDVIPKVVSVLKPAPDGPQMPDVTYVWNSTRVDIMVSSDIVTSEQKVRNLEHFAKHLGIKGVATGVLTKLVEAGHDSIKSLLTISLDDVLKIPGFQKTSATKIVSGIQKAKRETSCVDMMVASNIFGRGVGEKKIITIVKDCPTILDGTVPTLSQLTAIEGIGLTTATAFLNGLGKFYDFMKDIGMPCRKKEKALTPPPNDSPKEQNNANAKTASKKPAKDLSELVGAVVVFTGFRNKDYEKLVESSGGKVATSISGKTTLVVAADPTDSSTKIKKAQDLGVRIISKDDFAMYWV